MSLATVISLENSKTDWRRALTWTGSITAVILVAIGLMPNTTEAQTGETVTTYGLMQYPDRFWAYGAVALVSLAVLALLLKLMRKTGGNLSVIRMCASALFPYAIRPTC